MSRIVRWAWTLAAVVTIEAGRLFPGVGRVRVAERFETSKRLEKKGGGAPPVSDLDRTLRRFRRAVLALWAVNALLAASLGAALL